MNSHRRTLALAAAGLSALVFAALAEPSPRLVWNGSASVSMGFYRIHGGPLRKGDLVLARLPNWAQLIANQREYLPTNTPVLKHVAALHGDEICRFAETIFVNKRPAATALERDGRDRTMPLWDGCRRLERGEFLLLNNHPNSFDGRYFGPIDRTLIIGRAAPLWAYDRAD